MTNPDELKTTLQRVNTLGTATEQLFSRLYSGLRRRNAAQKQLERGPDPENASALQLQIARQGEEIERLNATLDAIGEGIVMQNLDGRIVHMNKAAKDLIGGRKAFWNSELGGLFNAYKDIVSTDSELMPLGEPTRVQVNDKVLGAQVAALANSSGQRIGTLIILRDALAEQLKDQFVTAISHELRTPMAVIKGMSDVVMAQPADKPPNRRFLETLSRNVDILDRMIVELLDISEMSASAFAIRRAPVDLAPLLAGVTRGIEPEVKKAGLDVAIWARDTKHLTVQGDEQRLRWALGHLLQNAVRYTESGGHIILTASLSDEEHVTIQVIDTGVGIGERDLPNIFDRFYRGEPRTASGKLLDPRGLGQGLFVAKTVTEAHGGWLNVHSQPGQGSVFTMTLPVDVSVG
jgi:two-component system phosphate regulon sensor histidine kinase PhoR